MLPTQDHEIIRIWAARNAASPAEILPLVFDSQAAVLTFLIGSIDGTPEIRPITWESFFAQFDLLGLSFACEEHSLRFVLERTEIQQITALEN